MAGRARGPELRRTDTARRFFVIAQVAFIVFVLLEVLIAEIIPLPATENTSSIGMKGDTAITGPWPMTLVWVIFVAVTIAIRQPIVRGVFAFLSTLYAISITAGNSTTVFATHHQFTGWKWTAVVALDVIAAVFTLACVVAAIYWAWCALRDRDALAKPPSAPSDPLARSGHS